jgi:hypothetical protein
MEVVNLYVASKVAYNERKHRVKGAFTVIGPTRTTQTMTKKGPGARFNYFGRQQAIFLALSFFHLPHFTIGTSVFTIFCKTRLCHLHCMAFSPVWVCPGCRIYSWYQDITFCLNEWGMYIYLYSKDDHTLEFVAPNGEVEIILFLLTLWLLSAVWR